MGTNFLAFPHSDDVVAFSHDMGNWWENPCIPHMMKYNIGWESNGKKASILWEKYDYQFPIFHLLAIQWILLHFPMLWEINEKTHTFSIWWSVPQDLNLMEKAPILWKLYGNQFLSLSLFERFCCFFPWYGKLIRKHMHFSYDEVYHKI